MNDYVERNEKLFKDYIEIMNSEIHVKITNKIKEKVEEYQQKTGVNKIFIAKRLGLTKQALSESFKSNNPKLETLLKFAIFLNCDISDLYTFQVKRVKIDFDE